MLAGRVHSSQKNCGGPIVRMGLKAKLRSALVVALPWGLQNQEYYAAIHALITKKPKKTKRMQNPAMKPLWHVRGAALLADSFKQACVLGNLAPTHIQMENALAGNEERAKNARQEERERAREEIGMDFKPSHSEMRPAEIETTETEIIEESEIVERVAERLAM